MKPPCSPFLGEGNKKKALKMTLAPLLPLWEKGLGDEGRSSICVR
jgi:hypothetical protein